MSRQNPMEWPDTPKPLAEEQENPISDPESP